MKPLFYISFLILGFSLFSCQKIEDAEVNSGEVVFYLKGELDGSSIAIEAGEDDMYMHTSYDQDSLGIYEFIGKMALSSCVDEECTGITICFRDNQESNSNESSIDESIIAKSYSYRAPLDSSLSGYQVSFQNHSFHQNNVTYYWDFGDGTTSSLENPIHTFDKSYAPSVVACLTVTDQSTGSISKLCNIIHLTGNCYSTFDYGFMNDTTLQYLNAIEQGVAPFNYLWDWGNGYLPLNSQPAPDFSTKDSIKICVQITDANGCQSSMCKYVIAPNPQVDCAAEFEWSKSEVSSPNLLDLNEVAISYTDESGKQWQSKSFNQPNTSYLEVSEVNSYKENTAGEPTKSVHLSGSCFLYGDSESDQIELTITDGVIAIAYP